MSYITLISLFSIFIIFSEFNSVATIPDFLSPRLSPFLGNLCKEVGCGRGKCKIDNDDSQFYQCECDPGWKQTLFPNQSHLLKFLPCVIPNCTLNSSCSEATAPAPSHDIPVNASVFEPCHWAFCGGGECNKTSAVTFSCECKEGYMNLLNNTGFPCFKECSIGGDCSNLGLPVSNKSTVPAPNLPDTGINQASSPSSAWSFQFEGLFHAVIVLVMSTTFLL